MFLFRKGSLILIYSLFEGPCNVVQLPTQNRKVVHPGMMTCGVGMVIDGRGSPEMFLKPFPEGPCRLPNVLFITVQPVTLVPVFYSTYMCDVILVLRSQQEVSDGITSLEVSLDLHYPTNVLKLLLKPFV